MNIQWSQLKTIISGIEKHFPGHNINFSTSSLDDYEELLVNIEIPSTMSVEEAMRREDRLDEEYLETYPPDCCIRLQYI